MLNRTGLDTDPDAPAGQPCPRSAVGSSAHQQREAIKRRDQDEESITEIDRSYDVGAATIWKLAYTPTLREPEKIPCESVLPRF
jgi:hypothetical protein